MTESEYNGLVKTKGGREQIIAILTTGRKSSFWSLIKLFLKEEQRSLEAQMNNLNTSIDDLQQIRVQLHYVKKLVGMPKRLSVSLAKERVEVKSGQVYD